eukprot:COSAG03_NODE_1644_length_3724_cov_1.777103_3_plen_219_part_00
MRRKRSASSTNRKSRCSTWPTETSHRCLPAVSTLRSRAPPVEIEDGAAFRSPVHHVIAIVHRPDCRVAAQDMLRDEFGIGQLGKRLKLLEAAKAANAKVPKTKRRAAPADPEPEPSKDVAVRQRKGKPAEQSRSAVASELKRKPTTADRRSMKQKIMDPKTVGDINELRSISVQMSDWWSRKLGGARDVVAVGSIVMSLAYWAATAMDVLPPGMSLLP